jgi:hypothetical protein
MSEDENFLSRWSRLKRRDASASDSPPAKPTENPQAMPATSGQVPESETPKKDEDCIDLSKLPSIESLTKDSDYSTFMQKGVPDDLRRQALRRLWQTNPELAAPDLLEMNMLDYTGNDGVKPLFQPAVSAVVEAIQKVVKTGEGAVPTDKAAASSGEKPESESETAAKAASPRGTKEPPNRG